MNKDKLDQFVLDIEFLLISVVQGVALGALATAASEPLSSLDWMVWPYILSGFLLILTFWSQAIVHSLSFIDWPLDLAHNFLYFLAGLVEVLAFSHLSDPLRWFIFQLLFVIVVGVLYWVDLRLIKQKKAKFDNSEARKKLYQHVLREQEKEFKTFVPGGFIFNVVCIWLVYFYPQQFLNENWHLILVGSQLVINFYIITIAIQSFKTRSKLISAAD